MLDGDTIRINTGEPVRYLGIDAPEKNKAYGQSATKHNEEYVLGKTVRLEYDYQTHDQYGRILAYVWVDDTLVNEKIVEEGYATFYTIPKTRKLKYADRLQRTQQWAKEHHNGMWIEEWKEQFHSLTRTNKKLTILKVRKVTFQTNHEHTAINRS